MSMQGWVGMKPLRVQALMTKLQAQRTQIDDLERQLASVQNQLNWEILSKGDIDNALQRARTKIKRRRELLENVERLMRESIDEFHEKDRLKTEQKSALEYWSSMGKGAATAVTGLSSLAIAGKDALWNKVGSIFQTGGYGGNSIPEIRVWYKMDTNPMKDKFKELINGGSSYTEIPSNLIVSTPDPVQRKLDVQDVKNLATKATGIINGINGSIGKFNAKKEELWNEFQENRQQEIADARERGLQGEKPDGMLLYTNYKAYSEQLEAWKSTLSEEELAAYEAYLESLDEEEEEEKTFFGKIKDVLCESIESEKDNWKGFTEEVGDIIDNQVEECQTKWDGFTEEVGGFVNDRVEDYQEFVSNVSDFVDEHPTVEYAFNAVTSAGSFFGNMVSGATAFANGDPIKGLSKTYGAINSFYKGSENLVALSEVGFGKLFDAIGQSEIAQEYYSDAEMHGSIGGLADEIAPANETVAGFLEFCDTVNAGYSVFTGLSSMASGITGAQSIGEVASNFFSWKSSEGTAISDADAFFSNAGIIFNAAEGIGTGQISDVFASFLKPGGLAEKYNDIYNSYHGVSVE